MTESLQQSIRRQLMSAAAAGSAAFEISGVLELSQPLDVYFTDKDNKCGCVSPCMQQPRLSCDLAEERCCERHMHHNS
jgi:hypothetical protein